MRRREPHVPYEFKSRHTGEPTITRSIHRDERGDWWTDSGLPVEFVERSPTTPHLVRYYCPTCKRHHTHGHLIGDPSNPGLRSSHCRRGGSVYLAWPVEGDVDVKSVVG